MSPKNILMRVAAVIAAAAVSLSPAMAAASADPAVERLAREKREELLKDAVDVDEFLNRPWHVRHRGLVIGISAGVLAIVAGGLTFGAAAGPAATAGAGAAHALLPAATGCGALETLAATGVAGSLFDGKSIRIPEGRRAALLAYYDRESPRWARESATPDEFAEKALEGVARFLGN